MGIRAGLEIGGRWGCVGDERSHQTGRQGEGDENEDELPSVPGGGPAGLYKSRHILIPGPTGLGITCSWHLAGRVSPCVQNTLSAASGGPMLALMTLRSDSFLGGTFVEKVCVPTRASLNVPALFRLVPLPAEFAGESAECQSIPLSVPAPQAWRSTTSSVVHALPKAFCCPAEIVNAGRTIAD